MGWRGEERTESPARRTNLKPGNPSYKPESEVGVTLGQPGWLQVARLCTSLATRCGWSILLTSVRNFKLNKFQPPNYTLCNCFIFLRKLRQPWIIQDGGCSGRAQTTRWEGCTDGVTDIWYLPNKRGAQRSVSHGLHVNSNPMEELNAHVIANWQWAPWTCRALTCMLGIQIPSWRPRGDNKVTA